MGRKKKKGVICPYCGEKAKLMDSAAVYRGRSYGMIWACLPCDAYVGCHKNSPTNAPLGRLADKELRLAKQEAHAVFDPLWKVGRLNRKEAYGWLAQQLNINRALCHIGMFDVDRCREVARICSAKNDEYMFLCQPRKKGTTMNATPQPAAAEIGHNNPPTDEEIMRERHADAINKAEALIAAADRLPSELDEDKAQKITDYIGQINKSLKTIEEGRVAEKKPLDDAAKVVQKFFKDFETKLNTAKAAAQKPLSEYTRKKQAEEAKKREEEAEKQRQEAEAAKAQAQQMADAGMEKEAAAAEKQAEKAEKTADRLDSSVATGKGLGAVRGATGATGTTRKVWTAEIVDINEIDLNAIKQHFKPEHVQQALNGAMKAAIADSKDDKAETLPAPKGARFFKKEQFSVRG